MPNLYQLPLNGSSAFVIAEESITVIDAGLRISGGKLLECIRYLGRSPEEIGHIVFTHYHFDHVGGVGDLKKRSDGQVALHQVEVPYVQGDGGARPPNPFQNPVLALLAAPLLGTIQPKPFQVDLPLQDGDRLGPLDGMEVIHTPGHTPGSISLHFPQHGVVIAGDALQCRRGRLGLPMSLFSENMPQARESIKRLAQLDFEVLCLSHFPPVMGNASQSLQEFAAGLA